MHMKVRITGGKLAGAAQPPPAAWKRLGNLLRERIILRTRSKHVDANGQPFAPYSEGYAALKRKAGTTTAVTLVGIGAKVPGRSFVPGKTRMLDDIVATVYPTNPRLVIGFGSSGTATIARYHMGEGRVDREFFALSDDDVDFAQRFIGSALKQTGSTGLGGPD